jgi:hypothetical protein
LALRDWRKVGGIDERRRMKTMIRWISIHLRGVIADMIVLAKRALKFIEWRKGDGIVPSYPDQETQLLPLLLLVLQNLERRGLEHRVDSKVSIRLIIPTTLQCLLLDVLDLHTGLKRASWPAWD